MRKISSSKWSWVVLGIFVLVPLVNFLGPAFLEGGNRFADDMQTRVNAAGYAFAIWGVIFTAMIVFSVFMLMGREPDSLPLRRALISLSIAGVASILFVPISIYGNEVLVWFDIVFHLVSLIIANRALRLHAAMHPSNSTRRWVFLGPSIYLGWICAATVISTALMANRLGIALGESTATGVALAVILLLGAVGVFLTILRDPVYGATVAWALIAVGVEQTAFPPIQKAACISAAVVLCVVVFQMTQSVRFFAVAVAAAE